jgi:multidrug efflux pump subunit AcrA (membrane-fusion protein)
MRPYITKFIAIIIVIGAVYGAGLLSSSKKKRKAANSANVPAAYVMNVINETIPVSIIENGRISAKYKIDIYSEVQGVMEMSTKEFKPGASYKKGETLLRIKSDEFYANLQAQKSTLQNLITAMMPDIKLDFPVAFKNWDAYLQAFDINKPIAPLPEPMSDKEKFFISGRNIYTTYYSTKNLEIIYSKYQLSAPFDGILTEALVSPGALIRNGQKLGEFINPKVYELEIAISEEFRESVQVGTEVTVTNPENEAQQWKGKVSRINGIIDPSTQTIQVFVSLSGDDLQEGMYLEANIQGKGKVDAIEVARNLLIDNNKLYVIDQDSTLVLKPVNVVHKTRSTIIVQGVDENAWLLTKAIPGAYQGMKVSVKPQE